MKKAIKIRVYNIEFSHGLNLPDPNNLFSDINPMNEIQFLKWKIEFIVLFGNIYLSRFNVNSFKPVYNSRFKRALKVQISNVSTFLNNPTAMGKKYAK